MSEEKKALGGGNPEQKEALNDAAVEDVAGGMSDWDRYWAQYVSQHGSDFDKFELLNCTDCSLGKLRACYYSHNNRSQAFKEFGEKPDAVCTHKRVI